MAEYIKQLNVKLTDEWNIFLTVVARYENVTRTELVRRWISDKLTKYQTNPQFKRWLKLHPEYRKLLEAVLP